MENYQMFFPCSSLSSSSAGSSSSSSSAYHQQMFMNNFHGCGSSGGFLGLKSTTTESITLPRSSELKDGVGPSGDDHQGRGSLSLVNDTNVSENDQLGKAEGKVKKGEKKVRKPRYAFQTRSQVDILDDGYRWRKYGQKAVKNNKFPRSYYRCTHHGCNVKKQVQRLTGDEGVVVTTYEGVHSHPIEKPSDNFEHILSQMQIYTPI